MAMRTYHDDNLISIIGINTLDLLTAFQEYVKEGYRYKAFSHSRLNPILPNQRLTVTKDSSDYVQSISGATQIETTLNGHVNVVAYNAEDFLGTVEDLILRGYNFTSAPVMYTGRYSATFVPSGYVSIEEPEEVIPEDIPTLADTPVVDEVIKKDDFDKNYAFTLVSKDDLFDYAESYGFKLDKRKSLPSMRSQLEGLIS